MSVINLDVPATARAVFRALWEPSPVEVVRAARAENRNPVVALRKSGFVTQADVDGAVMLWRESSCAKCTRPCLGCGLQHHDGLHVCLSCWRESAAKKNTSQAAPVMVSSKTKARIKRMSRSSGGKNRA